MYTLDPRFRGDDQQRIIILYNIPNYRTKISYCTTVLYFYWVNLIDNSMFDMLFYKYDMVKKPAIRSVKRKNRLLPRRKNAGRFGMPLHTGKGSYKKVYLHNKIKRFVKKSAKPAWKLPREISVFLDKPVDLTYIFPGITLSRIRLPRVILIRTLFNRDFLRGRIKLSAKSKRKKALSKTSSIKTSRTWSFLYSPRVKKFGVLTFGFSLAFCALLYFFIIKDLPSPTSLSSKQIPMTTQILDRNGKLLYRLYKDTNRIKLSWEEIPPVVKNATLAIEDAGFYNHPGISVKSIFRALLSNLGKNQITLYQGGSTITQQLVKNRLLSPEKSYERKLKEIILALWTERLYSKKDILHMYLNEVGYGGPAYGIEAASQMFFAKSAKELDLAQASFLAGLPASPTTFSPFGSNADLSYQRQSQVLERMFRLKMITKQEYEEAKNEKIAFAPQRIDIEAPHFVMFVKEQLINKLGEDMVTQGGLEIVTTLDLDIQHKTEDIVRNQIAQIKDRYKISNAAAVVTQPTTGEILAMVGSVDYFDTDNKGYVNATTALRQPGSSIKPINYGYAFDHGYTPNSVIEDAPVVYKAAGSTESYAPVNYDGKYHGSVTLRMALANSYNIPAVKLLNKTGVDNMIEMGKAMGIRTWENIPQIGLSLTLGGAEVTMLDMARAYGTIANLGTGKELKIVKEIHDSNGTDMAQILQNEEKGISLVGKVHALENKQVLSPLSAWWLIDILSDNQARLPAFGPYAKLTVPNHKVAVKTGTTNNFRDNWTIGFTPDYLVAAWVGNNDGSFMNKNLVSGITGAAPIWNETMTALIVNQPPKDFPKPAGLIPVKICATNGLLTCPNCPMEKTEYFTVDKVPTQKCYFRPAGECEEAKKQLEGKSDEEKKALMANCAIR